MAMHVERTKVLGNIQKICSENLKGRDRLIKPSADRRVMLHEVLSRIKKYCFFIAFISIHKIVCA
jgi:hypothetical protein